MAFGSNGGFKTGQLIEFAGNAAPDGFLPCNGAAVSRTTYAALFNVIGTIWGAGDGSTTFNLPNFLNTFVEGANSSGNYIEAGLPNITGAVGGLLYNGDGSSGAFSSYHIANYGSGGSSNNRGAASLDASRSSALYGKSSTVQPKSATVLICIKY